jgi:ATP-binding protein involved in chromosome partitioning
MIKPSDIASSLDEEMLPPFLNNNIKLMSYGYIQSQANQPAILRGPIASNVLKQLLFKTDWGYLDYLIVDCPPGTGDILLSLTQEIKLSGAVIVTNPHELSYIDVQKGIEMFRKVNVPIFSLIENMSYFICSNCDEKHHVFGSGKLQSFAKKYHLPQWFDLPIDKELANFQHKDSPFLFTCNNDNPTKAVIDRLANETIWQIANQKNDDEVSVSFDNENQEITFFQGEKEKTYTFKDLRLNCKCAYCVDEVSGEQLFFEENCDPNIKINHSFKVGHYAQGIEWLENGKTHQSMYSFKDLLI